MARKPEVLKREAIKEVIKCHNDPSHFINTYCKVVHTKRGLIPFSLYEYQERSLQAFIDERRVVINKSRQLGFSTLTAAFVVWLILFHNHKSVLIVATNEQVSKNLLIKIKTMLTHLPDWMYLADITTNQAHKLGLSNGSWVKAVARSDSVGRSEALSLLIIDEAAHIRDMASLWKSVAPTLSTGGKVIALSTPNGMGGNGEWFYNIYSRAETGENEWKHLEVNWWENPEYARNLQEDENVPGGYTSPWFKDMTSDMTEAEIYQEYITSFLQAGDTFIHPNIIQEYEKFAEDPISKELIDRQLWVWQQPKPGKTYLITADSCGGGAGGEDSAASYVIDTDNCEVVAEYKNKIMPDVFAEVLVEIAKKYNNGYIIVENNGVGTATALTLKRLEYKKLAYFEPDTFRLLTFDEGEYYGYIPGFAMTPKIRPVVMAKLEEYLKKKYLKIKSKRFIKELKTFIVKNGKPQAAKNKNDDLIMSVAIGIWIREVCPEFSSYKSSFDNRRLYDLVSVNGSRGVLSEETAEQKNARMEADKKRRVEEEKRRIREYMQRQTNIKLPDGTYQNIDWIYRL